LCLLKVKKKKSKLLRIRETISEKKHFETFQRAEYEKPPLQKPGKAVRFETFRFVEATEAARR
jgi:hypothetical protein